MCYTVSTTWPMTFQIRRVLVPLQSGVCWCHCNSRHIRTRQTEKQIATCLCRAHNLGVSRGRLVVLLPLLPIEPYCRAHTCEAQSVACLGLQYNSV